MDYKRFQIGNWVCSDFIITIGYKDNKRVMLRKSQKIHGKITGLKRFYLGRVNSGCVNVYVGEYCQGYLSVESSIVVWEVRQGKFNKPLYVLDEDIFESFRTKEGLPEKHIRFPYKWSDQAKADMRDEVRDWPRDSKGRWISGL